MAMGGRARKGSGGNQATGDHRPSTWILRSNKRAGNPMRCQSDWARRYNHAGRQTRYAQIEKEMLAIVFALEKFHQYTFGRHVRVQSDHKPLESIITKPLSCAPRRLQGMMMRIQKYNIEVVYRRGQDMHIADTLSRAYLPAEANERRTGQSDFEQINMAELLPITDERLKEIRQATACDESLQTLKTVILEGWPESKQETPSQAAQYFTMRDERSVQDGLIFKGQATMLQDRLNSVFIAVELSYMC